MTGPVRVEVYDMQGKLLFSGLSKSAAISVDKGSCTLATATNARAKP